MIYKCKICGGQTEIDSASGIATCEYCGTKQALPLFAEESERLLYDRGNHYLRHSEYDKAENVFNQLLTIKPNAAELHWALVLCKYGVSYVQDPKSGKYIPTCNRTHYAPIFSDENYKKTIDLSSGEKKTLFEEDAKLIDGIQRGILAVSRKEKPFDIFISYKETDANGNRTKDSVEAQKLYEKLTEAGYKVFFSRITLEDKIGTEYEPYIYAALYSSKVMLTVCSCKEYIEAVWVKNEWSRFLDFLQNDPSKTLLPLYFDMDKESLPEEFALLPSQDMHTNGFADELLRGIKKMIPLPIMKAKRRKKMLCGIGVAMVCVAVLAGVLVLQKNQARQMEAEVAVREEAYQAAQLLFKSADYTAAKEAFSNLGAYKDAADMVARCDAQQAYDTAMQLYYDGRYAEATWAFAALGDYEASAQYQEQAKRAWREQCATVTTETQFSLDQTYGEYYVSANGAVKCFEKWPGNSNAAIEINSHGKVVSIGDHPQLYALYEDGYVFNSAANNGLEADWTDAIQITAVLGSTNVALLADGRVVHGTLGAEDSWLEPVSTWKDIVCLSWDRAGWDYFDMHYAVLVGLDASGVVHYVFYDGMGSPLTDADKEALESLSNIKKIDLRYEENFYFAALNDKNDLFVYAKGALQKMEGTDYVDVVCRGNVYVLSDQGVLCRLNDTNVIAEDVVRIDKQYLVTRSGSIYGYSLTAEATEGKTAVKDVWLEGND